MKLVERIVSPVPKFFKKVRTIGLVLAAAGGAILASPIALPAAIVSFGGYLTAVGSVLAAISQVTVDDSTKK